MSPQNELMEILLQINPNPINGLHFTYIVSKMSSLVAGLANLTLRISASEEPSSQNNPLVPDSTRQTTL